MDLKVFRKSVLSLKYWYLRVKGWSLGLKEGLTFNKVLHNNAEKKINFFGKLQQIISTTCWQKIIQFCFWVKTTLKSSYWFNNKDNHTMIRNNHMYLSFMNLLSIKLKKFIFIQHINNRITNLKIHLKICKEHLSVYNNTNRIWCSNFSYFNVMCFGWSL